MRITALLAALALLAVFPAAPRAQTPTPTATTSQDEPAADPPADAPSDVTAVYDDYSDDGVIDVCAHTRDTLQATLDSIEADFDRDFPDFREAVRAGIQRHDGDRCDVDPTPTPTATPTATATADSGALPEPTEEDDEELEDGTLPPAEEGELPPAEEEGTPAPTATPLPTATPTVAAPVATPTPTPTTAIVARSRADRLLLPGILVGIALLGGATLAVMALTGSGSPRTRHAFSEAALRAKSTWADFSDWLRLGR